MNAFQELLALPEAEKKARGVEFTPAEIAQQPSTWAKTAELLRARRDEILAFLRAHGLAGNRRAALILTGAGSSQFVGDSIVNVLRKRLRREVVSIPTTDFVTHASSILVPGQTYVVLSFARSGNSPESVATFNLVRKLAPTAAQIVITCNAEGALARAAAADANSLCIALPPETNDKGLAMTSSFSTMAFAGIGLSYLNSLKSLEKAAKALGAGANRVMSEYGDLLQGFVNRGFTRACFLGLNALQGTMRECHLKLQEMAEGRIACMYASFVGLRHGPQVFVNGECAVIAALSSDAFPRKYELDMLRELKAKGQGCCVLVICDQATDEIRGLCTDVIELFPKGGAVADDLRVMTDVVVVQILGTFASIHHGLKPDNPSTSGTINRVVQGVTIYES